MLETIRRVKWKNILGLISLLILVIIVIVLVSVISTLVHGDCVEKDHVEVCFSVDGSTLGPNEVSTIKTSMKNNGETLLNNSITMRVPPNLVEMSDLVQTSDDLLAPGDIADLTFSVGSKQQTGRFKVEFDINDDGSVDKVITIEVE